MNTHTANGLGFSDVMRLLLQQIRSETSLDFPTENIILKGWEYPGRDLLEGRRHTVVTVHYRLAN